MCLVDIVVDVEHGINHAFHLDMRVEIEATLSQCNDEAFEFSEILWARHSGRTQELREERQITDFAIADIVEIIIALERHQLFDLGNGGIELRRCAWHAEEGVKRADVQFALGSERSVRLVMLLAYAASARIEPGGDAKRIERSHELSCIGKPTLEILERNFRRDKSDAASTSDEPARLAVGVSLDLAARRIGGSRVEVHRLHCSRIKYRVIVNRLQRHRVVGCDGIEFGAGEPQLVVSKLLF